MPRGSTWYDNGDFVKSGISGVVISVFATGATPSTSFNLVASGNTDPNHDPTHVCMDQPFNLHPDLRFSNARGFIATTAGVLDRPPGEWQICFAQSNLASATQPVFYTII